VHLRGHVLLASAQNLLEVLLMLQVGIASSIVPSWTYAAIPLALKHILVAKSLQIISAYSGLQS
jgi:hypothetical protein